MISFSSVIQIITQGVSMGILQSMDMRKSCRAFTDEPVNKQLLEEVLHAANRSPSYMNTQPWEIFVVAGAQKDVIAKQLFDQASSGVEPAPDLPFPKAWPETLEKRAKENRLKRFEKLGIAPEDKETIRENYLKNYQFFDAPCVIFIGMDRTLTPWSVFDLGSFTHGLLLCLEAKGLGACPQALPMGYPGIVRRELQIPEQTAVILAVSVGYPDHENPVNKHRSMRKELGDFAKWYGF
jgi:nitroreductase